MYLKKLTIKGFKSFAKKTELEFQPGISMIVGPNGTGKSNITDAVQWVLGEQSPSILRGSAMQDVIFAGSLNHKPLSLAEVTLTLDNTDKTLNLDFSEVSVTRRILRNGENIYFINSTPCRLLDIFELLHDTGLGRQTHSIIGQGRLEEVISSKPEEKRALLEEAAGVLKHKKRKERALRKLISTEENLKRGKDILKEINRQLRPLEEQVGKAKIYRELNEKLKNLEIASLVKKISRLKKKAEDIEKKEDSLQNSCSPLERELKSLTEKINLEEQRHEVLAKKARELQNIKDRVTNLKANLQNIFTLEKHKELSFQKGIQETQEQLSILESQSNVKKAQVENLIKQIKKLETERNRNLKSIALKRKESEKLLPDITGIENQLKIEKQKLIEIEEQINTKEKQSLQKTNNLHFLHKESGKNKQKAQALDEEISICVQEIEKLKKSIARNNIKLSTSDEELNLKIRELKNLQNKLKQNNKITENIIHNKANLEGQLTYLKNLQSELEPTQMLKKASQENVSCTSLAKFLKVKKQYTKAVESYLGSLVKGLVVNNFVDAKELLTVANEERQNVSVIIKGEQAESSSLNDDPFTSKAPAWLKSIFKNVVFVENINNIPHEKAQEITFVTLKGEIFFEGILRADYRSTKKGFLSLSNKISEKSKTLNHLNGELESSNAKQEILSKKISKLNKEVEFEREAINKYKAEKSQIEARLKLSREVLSEKNQAFEDINKAIQSSKKTGEGFEGEKQALNKQLELLTKRRMAIEKNINSLNVQHKAVLEEKQKNQLSSTELNYQAKNVNQQLLSLKNQLSEAKDEYFSLNKQRQKCVQKISRLERTMCIKDKFLPTVAVLKEASYKLEDKLAKKHLRDDSLNLLKNLRAKEKILSQELKDLENEKQHLALEKGNLKANLDNLADCIIQEHNLAIETAIQKYSHFETNKSLILATKQQINEIGPVNAVAEEQFNELYKRRHFLEKQIEDLVRSKNSVSKIIRAIDKKIKESLLQAFQEISQNFKQLFSRLFPGGQAELILTGANIFESGLEVKAQPYGKNLKKLSLLSGGETALTALALLFAVYHTKPSPFYVLDEVEASLDDINLQRFIRLLKEMKPQTQFIVITHQRRTMEVADSLYGITMHSDGISKIVSQKMPSTVDKELVAEVNVS